MIRFRASLAILAASCLMFACGGGGGGGSSYYPRFSSSDNEILQFTVPVAKNASLAADVTGQIKDDAISVQVPYNADVTSLVTEFVTNSTDVEVNSIQQKSGQTVNDFTSPVVYSVIAENQSIRKYTVTITKAPSPEKYIDSFALDGTAGSISQDTGEISVEMPERTSLASLAATFSGVAKLITVDGVVQTSGDKSDFSNQKIYTVTACDGSSRTYKVTATVKKSSFNKLTSFYFDADLNRTLALKRNGTIDNNNNIITVDLPYGSSKTGLIASFETENASVYIDKDLQVSGTNLNDFSGDLIYRVTAENGDVRDYTVQVKVAKNYAKDITRFVLDGERAVIDETNLIIPLSFPAGKDVSKLVADFDTTGESVSVNGQAQAAGETANDFSSEVIYTVKAEDGTAKNYKVKVQLDQSIAGLWNFEYDSDGSYTVSGAGNAGGLLGSALSFNGYSDYVLIPDSDTLTLGDAGTIDVLVNVTSHKPFAGIVHKGIKTDFSDESYSLQFWGKNGTDGTVRISLFNAEGANIYIDSTQKLQCDKWYHIVATWDSSYLCLYINNNRENIIANTIGKVRVSKSPLIIGAQLGNVKYSSSWGNLGFNGIIDRVQILEYALTAEQVGDEYKSFQTESGGALTAYLLGVASRNSTGLGIMLGAIILVLGGLYMYNRKHLNAAG